MSFDLRTARLNAGLSQRALADLIGVPKNTLAAYENGDGTYRPHPANAKKIADYFDIQVTDLMPVEEGKVA